jgi:hypothetical protein
MTKHIVPALALSAVAVVALAGCVPVWAAPMTSGPRVSDDRTIESVEAVEVRTDGDLTVVVGDTASLTITAPQSVMDRLTSDIVDGVLVLDVTAPRWGFGLGDISYQLTVPRLTSVTVKGSSDVDADFSGADEVRIEIDGSGDVDGSGIDATSVRTEVSGSGDIELTGRTDDQVLEIDGSADVDASDLVSRVVRVSIAGSGDVEVHATETLDAEISGSGQVRYRGGASVTSAVSGSGSVRED